MAQEYTVKELKEKFQEYINSLNKLAETDKVKIGYADNAGYMYRCNLPKLTITNDTCPDTYGQTKSWNREPEHNHDSLELIDIDLFVIPAE